MSRGPYFKHKQALLMAERAREKWGDEFTKMVVDFNDGDTLIECYHVAGTDEEGRTIFEELRWHSGKMGYGEAYEHRSRSLEPDRARNDTGQVSEAGEYVDLEAQSDL